MDEWTSAYSMEQVGAFLRKVRRTKGATQSEFAETIGVSHATLSALENGRSVSTRTLEKALQFLGYKLVIMPKNLAPAVDTEVFDEWGQYVGH